MAVGAYGAAQVVVQRPSMPSDRLAC